MLSVEDLKTYQKALVPAYTIEAERNYVKLSLSYLKRGNQDHTEYIRYGRNMSGSF